MQKITQEWVERARNLCVFVRFDLGSKNFKQAGHLNRARNFLSKFFLLFWNFEFDDTETSGEKRFFCFAPICGRDFVHTI